MRRSRLRRQEITSRRSSRRKGCRTVCESHPRVSFTLQFSSVRTVISALGASLGLLASTTLQRRIFVIIDSHEITCSNVPYSNIDRINLDAFLWINSGFLLTKRRSANMGNVLFCVKREREIVIIII